MFEDAHYRWREEPDDGEYELQFDRFESLEDHHDQICLLVVDEAEDWPIGDVVIPTDDVPEIAPDDTIGTAIFRATIEDGTLVALEYDPELTEQGIKEAEERYERIRSTPDDENTDIEETEDQ